MDALSGGCLVLFQNLTVRDQPQACNDRLICPSPTMRIGITGEDWVRFSSPTIEHGHGTSSANSEGWGNWIRLGSFESLKIAKIRGNTVIVRPSLPRLPIRPAFLSVFALALGLGLFWGFTAWRYRAELSAARRDEAAGRFDEARQRLARLSARWPGRDEVEYPLGTCEAALGHVADALDAWGRIPDGSPFRVRAALERARLALTHGRLAAAESSLARVLDEPGAAGDEASKLAQQLDLFSGRSDRIAGRIERRWRSSADQAGQLRAHWLFGTQPLPFGPVGEALDRFALEAPDDDRVWLGRADLTIRSGRHDEADAWLTKCEGRRPDDPDVRKVRLFWALESGNIDAAVRVLKHLPANRFPPEEVAALASRFAALRGDEPAERAALRRRVELKPGDAAAWERLADMAARDGAAGVEFLREARRRKADLDAASDQYRMLMNAVAAGNQTDFAALARAAEALSRRFEAESWWSLRARQRPDDPEARAALRRVARPRPAPPLPANQTLADLIAVPNTVANRPAVAPRRDVPAFRDDAAAAGLRFTYVNDESPLRRLPESIGGGLGLIDYDGDGWLDVYAVQGGKFPPPAGPNGLGGDRLFHNRRDGTFEDATDRAGIAAFSRGYGHGVAVGDYDNDGRPDLFITRWRSYALYHNRGDGSFEDATDRAGLGGARGWPTSAAFADLDGDGDLDLYVCHYLHWDADRSAPCLDPDHPGGHVYCVPRAFEAEADHVFRNDGGRFVDVTEEAGIIDLDGRGLGVVVADLDGDAKPEIFVANDMTANLLYQNLGGFRFEEVGLASGVASNAGGGYQAGMGIACGDVDGDGRPDLAVTNFYGESVTLYRNLGGGLFADRTGAAGLAAPTRYQLGFGTSFFDADNDGRLDLAVANGHVNDYRPSIPYAMPAQLFLGAGGGRFTDASASAGACWSAPRVGRGLAVGDLDNDGRDDVLILSQNGPLAYFHNLGPAGRRITLQLEGTKSNRDGVGAVVRVSAGGVTQTLWRLGGGSFLSASDGRVRVGLGPRGASPLFAVEVIWPSGRIDHHNGLTAGAFKLIEGDPRPHSLNCWPEDAGTREETGDRSEETGDSCDLSGFPFPSSLFPSPCRPPSLRAKRAEPAHQRVEFHGLDQDVGGAGGAGASVGVDRRIGRDRHDRDRGGRRRRAEPADQLEPVEDRHHQVGQNQVRQKIGQGFQRGLSIRGLPDHVTASAEHPGEELAKVVRILHDEHVHRLTAGSLIHRGSTFSRSVPRRVRVPLSLLYSTPDFPGATIRVSLARPSSLARAAWQSAASTLIIVASAFPVRTLSPLRLIP